MSQDKKTLSHSKVARLALDATLLCLALILSYVELFIPLNLIIPLPGFKLGFANIIVMLAFYIISPRDAIVVSVMRVALSSLLFGNAMSFCFSLSGAILSLVGLYLARKFLSARLSFIGVSVLSAALHNLGQTLAAGAFYGWNVILSYLPILLLASAVFGAIVGIVVNLSAPRLEKIYTAKFKPQNKKR